ncbi:hypothetical protein [Candidatus Hadarchaeum sp.]|uniref:hypothetical protein n=1 Tax=Candidatus Hadarchaeum sp. TaxID=2883567 RepID=UPI00319DEB4B
MRNCLNALVGQIFQEDFIEELLDTCKIKPFQKLGVRAWKWNGKYGTLQTIDTGNGWHLFIKVNRSY